MRKNRGETHSPFLEAQNLFGEEGFEITLHLSIVGFFLIKN